MINKLLNSLREDFKRNYKFYLIMIFILSLFLINFDYYIYSPGSLIDLTDRIKVENSYDEKGSFNLTYVTARKANIVNIALSYVLPSWDMVSIDESRIEDESKDEIEKRNVIYLKETSYDAIIAAFNEANIEYNVDSTNVTITYVFNTANTNLKVGDIIKSVDGKDVKDALGLKNIINTYNEKDKVNIKVLRDNKEIECYGVLYKEESNILIGVSLAELKEITTNPKVEYIFKDNESGSSRGLMCALDIYNKITSYDLTKGRVIAGTGSIDEYGKVSKIDGVKYKLKGAVNKHADIFIVPEGNYDEAIKLKEKYNYDIEIIKADNLHNVIEKLK